MIKGSKEACEKIAKYLTKFNNAGFDEINFDHDFLLWILYRYDQFDGVLSNDMQIERIDKGRTQGTNSNENDISFKDGQSRVTPLTTIYGLLNEHQISHIGGDYKFRSDRLNFKTATDLTIHIYSEHVLRQKTYAEKCELSFPAIIEIVEVYEPMETFKPKGQISKR